jgi:hypothetical protein
LSLPSCAAPRPDVSMAEQPRLADRELRELIPIADRFIRALAAGDSATARSVLQDPGKWDLYVRVLAVRERFLAQWSTGYDVTASGWVGSHKDTAAVEFEVPVRSQVDSCYPGGVFDRVTFWLVPAGRRWQIATVSVPLC